MTEDYWSAFRQREVQQRQMRDANRQRLSEEQDRKRKEAEAQYILREQARSEVEQRLGKERSAVEQQANEKRRIDEEKRAALLVQSAGDLRRANQQKEDAQRIASERIQSIQEVKQKGSPIERIFFEAWCEAYPGILLKRQHPIGKYFVDFAHVESQIAIELDGHAFHSSRKDRTRDAQRERWIQSQGWRVERFTGSEVFADVQTCVEQVMEIIRRSQK